MKPILILALVSIFHVGLLAQDPVCTFNYQAAIRDASDNVIPNRNVGMRLSMLETIDGMPIYTEEHTTLTSNLGLVDLEIGGGVQSGGTMTWNEIPWGEKPLFLRLEVDVNGGTNYEMLGEAAIRSVPISNYSKTSLTALGLPADAVINISQLNAERINATDISADDFGYYDDFGNFKKVLTKNGGLFIFFIDKIFAEDICTGSVAIKDGPVGIPYTALGFDKDGKSFVDVDKIYAADICADDLTIFDDNGDPFFDVNPGANQITEYGFVFNHNIMVNGGIMAEFKQFVIDHPLDPENKRLRHFSIESDQMLNIYSGVVQLDKKGTAWVQLPEWFEALNTNFTYQLTCIGGYANVFIDKEIKENKFKIAGGKKNMKVSWNVSGVRHDKQSQEHMLPVVELKTP
jgi:hypothetical protein